MNVRQATNIKSLQSTSKWIDTNKAFDEGGPCRSDRESLQKNGNSETGQTCMQGLSALEALNAFVSIAANHKQTHSIRHIDVSIAYFTRKYSETCAGTTSGGGRKGVDACKHWVVDTRGRMSNNWDSVQLARTYQKLRDVSLELSSTESVSLGRAKHLRNVAR